MRPVRRFLAVLVVVLAVGVGFSTPAFADPSSAEQTKTLSPEQRVKIAQEVCSSTPGGWSIFDFASPRGVCEAAVKFAIERDGQVTTANLCAAIAFANEDLAKQCSAVVQPVVAATQQALGAAAKAVAEVAECAPGVVTGEWYECVSKKIHLGLAQASNDTWRVLGATVTQDTKAVSILDLTSNTSEAKAFRSVYIDVVALSMPIVMIAGIISLITAALRRRGRPLWDMLTGVATFGLFWAGSLTLATFALKAGDGVALLLAGENGSKLELDQGGMARWMDAMTTALPSSLNTGNLMWLVMTCILFIGIFVQLVILALREVSLPLIAVVIPVALALQAGPEAVRKALPRLVTAFLTIVVAKPLMVLALRLANSFLQAAVKQDPTSGSVDLWSALLGTVMLFMALFFTGAVYKLFNLTMTEAGRHGGGSLLNLGQNASMLAGSGGHSGGSMAQQAATANRLQSGSMAAGGAKAAAAGGAAGALPVVGLGLAAVAGAGAAMRGIVSQGATGGGALEDAEGITLPPPPARRPGGLNDGGAPAPAPSPAPAAQNPTGQQNPGSNTTTVPQPKGVPAPSPTRSPGSQPPPQQAPIPSPPPSPPGYNPKFTERKAK